MHARLHQEAALGIAFDILDLIRPLIRPEEERDFVSECLEVIHKRLALLEENRARQHLRLYPMEEKK